MRYITRQFASVIQKPTPSYQAIEQLFVPSRLINGQQRTSSVGAFISIIDTLNSHNVSFATLAHQGWLSVVKLLEASNKSLKVRVALEDTLDNHFRAVFELLNYGVFVGYVVQPSRRDELDEPIKPTEKPQLYTRSVDLLRHLARDGFLVNGDKIENILIALNRKTMTSLPKGLQAVVRLDKEGYVDGKPVFNAVIPQTALKVGKEVGSTNLEPLYAYEGYADFILQQAETGILEIGVLRDGVSKVYRVTSRPDIVSAVYGAFPPDRVATRVNSVYIGFNVMNQSLVLYDLESPFSQAGVVSIPLSRVLSINLCTPDKVNKRRHNLDYNIMRSVFLTKINGLTRQTAPLVRMESFKGYATLKDFRGALLYMGQQLRDEELQVIMETNPEVFGDFDTEIESRKRLQLREIKDMVSVGVPSSTQDRYNLIAKISREKVLRVTYKRSKDDKPVTVVVTNNKASLNRVYTDEARIKMEPPLVRLGYALEEFATVDILDKADIERISWYYDLYDKVSEIFDYNIPQQVYSSDIVDRLKAIRSVYFPPVTSETTPTAILVRNMQAKTGGSYLIKIPVDRILTIEASRGS